MIEGPSHDVIAAFGGRGSAVPLGGGRQHSFRVDDLVIKAVDDPVEAAWVGDLCSRLEPDGFRLADPVLTVDGQWVRDGWVATRFIEGLRPLASAWNGIIDIGLRFGEAAGRVGMPTNALATRTHRWARADRVAWGEEPIDLDGDAAGTAAALASLCTARPSTGRAVIHGDLTGNVALDPDGVPVVLDVSPYVRPARWAAAIVVADAVMWNGGPPSLARSFAADDVGRDLLGRALLFRLVAEQLAERAGEVPRHLAALEPYQRLLAELD